MIKRKNTSLTEDLETADPKRCLDEFDIDPHREIEFSASHSENDRVRLSSSCSRFSSSMVLAISRPLLLSSLYVPIASMRPYKKKT